LTGTTGVKTMMEGFSEILTPEGTVKYLKGGET